MTVVVDTSVLIDHLRGRPEARDALSHAVLAGERIVGSVLTRTEVLAGMRASESIATRALLDALDWVSVDEEIADAAGHLANQYLRSHPGVDTVDYVIAATTDRVSGRLWTRNIKHFPMFADLQPPY